jgi:hypothetical protein
MILQQSSTGVISETVMQGRLMQSPAVFIKGFSPLATDRQTMSDEAAIVADHHFADFLERQVGQATSRILRHDFVDSHRFLLPKIFP